MPWIVAASALALTVLAQPEPWAGLETLREIGDALGHPVRGGERVDLGVVGAQDGLLIVEPHHDLPVAALSAFLDAGGRLGILDDFGAGRELLSAYRIERRPAPVDETVQLRDNPDLLVAQPATDHPLARGVAALLTNRPVALRHNLLKPVYTYSRTEQALVLAGAVGEGRLVAVGDSSLLINQQLALPSQRQFARNLIGYLAAGGGEVWLIGPRQELFGTFGHPHRPGVERIDAVMGRLSHPDLPVWMVMALAAAGVAAVAIWMLGSLPKATPYLTPHSLPSARVWAGFAGRIDAAQQGGRNMLWAALDYRAELMADCARALDLDTPPDRRTLLKAAALKERPCAERKRLDALLQELDALAAAEDRPEQLPRVDPDQLARMVTTGEQLLRELEMKSA